VPPNIGKIAFVAIIRKRSANGHGFSDEDAKKLFEQRRDRLGTPELRQVSQMVFPMRKKRWRRVAASRPDCRSMILAKERDSAPPTSTSAWSQNRRSSIPRLRPRPFHSRGEVSQPVQGKFRHSPGQDRKIGRGSNHPMKRRHRPEAKLASNAHVPRSRGLLRDKMEDERGGGASVIEAAQKLGLAAVTIDAVDRSGRLPGGQLATNIPTGLDVVSQAFNSDVGVDNDPISFRGGYVWYDVVGITPSRERNLDEVKDQVEAAMARRPDQ